MFLRFKRDSGFTMLELVTVVAIVGIMAAIGLPLSMSMIDDIKTRGDAQALSSAIAQTKLTSAAKFTHARLFANFITSTYRIQAWNRTGTPGWVNISDEKYLSDRSLFGFGSVVAPPPNTVAALIQAPECTDDLGLGISDTGCLIFSSRGIQILANGTPAPTQALYITGPSGVFTIIVGVSGQLQLWKTTQTGANDWRQQ